MPTYQYFKPGEPRFHDADFYRDRPVSDHIHEAGHRERLLRTLADVGFVLDLDKESRTVSDLGCGNGGFLHELSLKYPLIKAWGYDLSPLAVEDGREKYGADARLKDFVNEDVEFGDVVVLTEVLEHLVDPPGLLRRIRGKSRWIVASCPSEENEKQHYEFHLWAWTPDSWRRMFEREGYVPVCHYLTALVPTQFMVARNP